MANKLIKTRLLSYLPQSKSGLSIHEIQARLPEPVAERTLRRWLAEEIAKGRLLRSGQKRASRYHIKPVSGSTPQLAFLEGLSDDRRTAVVKLLRDLWTHSSTALEGNTLTLGDTHFVLEEGLTISGKPIKDHQEVLGHASAIELIYQSLSEDVTEQLCFELHKAIQTEIIFDIDKPNGAWKVQPNGTYTVGVDDKPVYLEYALPLYVPALMKEVIAAINSATLKPIPIEEAHIWYAKFHAAIAHIHPFWDGNGRLARLLANIPLLKSGVPPIVVPKESRREYIQLLAAYEISVGQLDKSTGAWPAIEKLKDFTAFCLQCYATTRDIING